MAEDQPAESAAPEASASAPAPQSPDFEKIKAEILAAATAEMDARVGGFQTVINRLTEENRQLKTAGLSEDEREQLAQDEKDQRIVELERQVALNEVVQKYPDVAEVYQKLLNAKSEEEQAKILLEMVKPAAPAEPDAEPPSDVDKNNPAQTTGEIIGRLPDGTPLTGDTAWEYLKRLGPTPMGEQTRG